MVEGIEKGRWNREVEETEKGRGNRERWREQNVSGEERRRY